MTVLIREDRDSGMMEIYVDGKLFVSGNSCDIYTRETMMLVIEKIGVKISRGDFEYDT